MARASEPLGSQRGCRKERDMDSANGRKPAGALRMSAEHTDPTTPFAARMSVEQVEEGLDPGAQVRCRRTDPLHHDRRRRGRSVDAGLHEWRGATADNRDRRGALLEPKPAVPLAQGSDEWPHPGSCGACSSTTTRTPCGSASRSLVQVPVVTWDTGHVSTDRSTSAALLVDLFDSCSRSHGNPLIRRTFTVTRPIRRSFEWDSPMPLSLGSLRWPRARLGYRLDPEDPKHCIPESTRRGLR